MKIPSHQLEAFFAVAQKRSFSKAADALAITQSALSQRVAHLEEQLEVTLFIRDTSGPRLTETGEVLLKYCQVHHSLESEFLNRLKSQNQDELRGVIRIAGFSSVLRSVIIPSLAPFLRAQPHVHCEFRSYEVAELPDVLKKIQADLVILDYHLNRADVVETVLGQERYVVIESALHPTPANVYLDHGPHDNATESFFAAQSKAPAAYRRSFMGDVYGIIDGVRAGLGRAVMSEHMVRKDRTLRKLKGFKPYTRDITLHHFSQPFYPRLHLEVVRTLTQNAPGFL